MSIKKTKQAVEKLVNEELKLANESYPPFNSAHEGYAVLMEEVEELQDECKEVDGYLTSLWEAVKDDDITYAIEFGLIYNSAVRAACEAIQVAAMAIKFEDLYHD